MAQYFLYHFARRFQKPLFEIGPEARQGLLAYGWPGNVREVRPPGTGKSSSMGTNSLPLTRLSERPTASFWARSVFLGAGPTVAFPRSATAAARRTGSRCCPGFPPASFRAAWWRWGTQCALPGRTGRPGTLRSSARTRRSTRTVPRPGIDGRRSAKPKNNTTSGQPKTPFLTGSIGSRGLKTGTPTLGSRPEPGWFSSLPFHP